MSTSASRLRQLAGWVGAFAVPALAVGLAVLVLGSGTDASSDSRPPRLARAELTRLAGSLGSSPVGRGSGAVRGGATSSRTVGPPPARPVRVRAAAIGLDAPVVAMREAGGELVIPAPDRAGWYAGGPAPGEPGRVVIVGHLDTTDGPAVFGRLSELRSGIRIVVLDRNGRRHLYETVATTEVEKDDFPTSFVYGPSRNPTLTLITCAGTFDEATHHYDSNLIVLARAI